ncbi:chemotaxis protein CheW [Fluviispira vulneris]|uniref:chemotaxis protein CheW n=1 Tax=Fluviispira vulneris TaxID=2763012 RepID=UPI001647B8EF|nr:chemotaxis protein CheW [Fluviispira vulneris]
MLNDNQVNESHINETDTEGSIDNRYLCFSLGYERFAIPLLQVREVIGVPEFTRIPYAPKYFCGIMNLRGKVISVIDLREKLNIQSRGKEENCVIVCNLDHILMGALVDSIDFVANIKKEEILEKPETQTTVRTDFIKGLYNYKHELIVFLHLAKTLSIEDILQIQKSNGTEQL